MQKSTSTNGSRTSAAIPVTVRMDKNVNRVIVTNSASGTATASNNNGSASGGPSTCWRGRRNKWKAGAAIAMAIALVGLGFNVWFATKLFLREDEKNICLSAACVRTAASLLSAMDETVDPCDDFFMFACGNWNKRHLIPEDRSSVSTFEVLSDQIQVILKGLLEEGLTRADSEAIKKAKYFYVSCMNSSAIKDDGLNAISGLMRSMGGWPVVEGGAWQPTMTFEKLVATIRAKLNINILVESWVGPDDTNSSRNVLQLDQMQLGLPSRDYFLNSSRELLAYENYMIELAVILGASRKSAELELADVVDLEIRLANIAASEADRHDTSVIYKKMTLEELQSQVPGFGWREYFEVMLGQSVKDEDEFVTYAFPYLQEMADIVRREELRTVQNYIMWRTLMELTSYLVGDFQEKKIEFRKVLMGITSERNRWHECVEWANKKMGFAVGALFIRENFDPQAKETAQEMIGHIREAFIDLLEENEWMDEPTRKLAREKAMKMNERIGYPEFIKVPEKLNAEYENLTISTLHFLENIVNIGTWKAKTNFARLQKPVDRERWSTEPAVVNAFYDPNKNDIVFPAGILQPLFYSHQFPKSLNYGGIGVVIGHEITHGFDDKGRLYDKEGNMIEWWNNGTITAFRTQAQCVIEQYSQYQVMNFTVNGYMTQGENIADNGGLKQAYRAFKKWEETHSPEPLLPGLEDMTHDQYFFLNYGQIWCGSMRYEDLLSRIRTAVHSPPSLRVLGPLSNSRDFSRAFKCKTGSRMNPLKKCSVW